MMTIGRNQVGTALVVFLAFASRADAQATGITDLQESVSTSTTGITLAWTAVTNNGFTDYELRQSTQAPITSVNWDDPADLTRVTSTREGWLLTTSPTGQTLWSVGGLSAGQTYHFALKYHYFNWSDVSNSLSITFDPFPPDAIASLNPISVQPGGVTLQWLAPADDAGYPAT